MKFEYRHDKYDFNRWVNWRRCTRSQAFSFRLCPFAGSLVIEYKCPECDSNPLELAYNLEAEWLKDRSWRQVVAMALLTLRKHARREGHYMIRRYTLRSAHGFDVYNSMPDSSVPTVRGFHSRCT